MMKPIPSLHYLRICLVMAALAVMHGKIAPCSAEMIDCPRFLPPKNQEWYKPGEIKGIQKELNKLGYGTIREDGLLGNQTISAIKKYCMTSISALNKYSIPSSFQLTQQDLDDQRQAAKVVEDLKQTAPSENKNELTQLVKEAKENLPKRFHSFLKICLVENFPDLPTHYNIDQKSLGLLHNELIPETVLKKLEPLVGFNYPTVHLFDNALEVIAKIKSEDLKKSGIGSGKIHRLAEKNHPMDQSVEVHWKSDPCGCAPHFERVVYGFYPYWTPADVTDEKEATQQAATIHYSALSRIGFYALFMEESGEWRTPELWEKHRASFIKTARKYRVKTDLVVHNPDWLHTAVNHSEKIAKALTDLVQQTPGCDGVTLYFEKYPDTEKPLHPFKVFLKQLYETSKNQRRPFFLNLMLPAVYFGEDRGKRLTDFLSIFEKEDEIFADLLIVFLYKPTSSNKKEMRYRIEEKFTGLQRRSVFRKVIPVISPPLYPDDQQFKDDLVYFEDNFAGVAFWPTLTGKEKRINEINRTIRGSYGPEKNQAMDQTRPKKKSFSDSFCAWICPNRIVMLWIIAAGLLLGIGGSLSSIRICALRSFFQRYFWYVLGGGVLLVILLFSLLACVPDWSQYIAKVSIAITAVLILLTVYRQIQRIKREKYP